MRNSVRLPVLLQQNLGQAEMRIRIVSIMGKRILVSRRGTSKVSILEIKATDTQVILDPRLLQLLACSAGIRATP